MALKWTKDAQGALNSHSDQPRLSKLTKAIGMAAVFGATAALSPMAQAIKTDFGLEYRATAFANQLDEDGLPAGATDDSDTGFGHLIRVKSNFLDEDTGISVYTSVEVAGDRWVGNNHPNATGTPSYNSSSRGDSVRLDLGYVQIPVGHTVFRVGRQATSYNNCFLVCDDRRDRILMVQPFSKTTSMVLGYDRRSDATPYSNVDNGDMSLLGVTSKISDWDASLLWVQWYNNYEGAGGPPTQYPLSNVTLFSGYLDGSIGEALNMAVGFNVFTNGNVETGTPGDDRFFQEDAPSAYLRLGTNVGIVDLGVQYAATRDGGLISPGFDTWSSLINSNPEATQSASSLYRMGGTLGRKDFDEDLLIGRAKFNLTPKFSITGAVGQLSVDNGTVDDDSMVYDLQFAYQANKSLRTWLSVGMMEENEAGTLAGNDLLGFGPSDGGSFANDDVKAASLNMSVSF